MTQTTYNTANVETYNFRGFTVKYSSTVGDYRVYDGETFIGDALTMQGVNKVIDAEMKHRQQATTAPAIVPATFCREWQNFAHEFQRADDLNDPKLCRAWHSFCRYMDKVAGDMQDVIEAVAETKVVRS